MKTVSKKLLSLLLVVLLLAAAVPFQAFAEGTEYEVSINVRDADTNESRGTKEITVSTENPATKTKIDEAVAKRMTDYIAGHSGAYPDGYYIDSYTDAAGSPVLTDQDVLPDTVKSIIVKVKTKTPPAVTGVKVNLDGNGGTIAGYGTSAVITVTKNTEQKYVLPTLPTATRTGYTFLGWFEGNTQVENGKELTEGTEYSYTAKWTRTEGVDIQDVKVKGVKTTQSLESAFLITQFTADTGDNLLECLNAKAASIVNGYDVVGYQVKKSGSSILWYNYNGSQTLAAQDQVANSAVEVLVKFVPKTFTLYFQVDGGKVDPTSKTVTYDSKVGTLPTPTKSGEVFMGWFDSEGVQYTSETVYKVNGNTTLTARWQNESSVLLRIYLSPNTTTPDRIVDITGKVNGNSIGRTEVESVVTKYYTGSNMKLIGLFSDATWASYKAGSITEGTPNVTIQEDVKTTNVHVVVTGATNKPNSNNNGSSSTTATTKPADPDNPKTGDSMMIYTASAVMVLAAAALVTVQVLRKKRTY